MTRATTLLLATGLFAATLALAPTASAAAECTFDPPPSGGIVGRTIQYVVVVADTACDETFAYATDVCIYLLGPSALCYAL